MINLLLLFLFDTPYVLPPVQYFIECMTSTCCRPLDDCTVNLDLNDDSKINLADFAIYQNEAFKIDYDMEIHKECWCECIE